MIAYREVPLPVTPAKRVCLVLRDDVLSPWRYVYVEAVGVIFWTRELSAQDITEGLLTAENMMTAGDVVTAVPVNGNVRHANADVFPDGTAAAVECHARNAWRNV